MAGKSGGAWKVAYADFVTAMMAFFLVMWICGQDQKVRRAVSFYFQDPFGEEAASSKKPRRAGALSEYSNAGSVPDSESVALGPGRKSYTLNSENGVATKLVGDWLAADKDINAYWCQQAQRQRAAAEKAANGAGRQRDAVDRVAARQLAKQLRDEFSQEIPRQMNDLHRNLLRDAFSEVNWMEIAEDLLAHN